MTLREELDEQPTSHEIEFMQCLFDRYSEDGGVVDIGRDGRAFLSIVRKHWVPRTSQLVPLPEVEELAKVVDLEIYKKREIYTAMKWGTDIPKNCLDHIATAIINHMKGK